MGTRRSSSRERLAAIALQQFAEVGFENATVAGIARAAGVTERTFYRNFSDKREVVFAWTEAAEHVLTAAIDHAPAQSQPLQSVIAAITELCREIDRDDTFDRSHITIIAASAELREREQIKYEAISQRVVEQLTARGTSGRAAQLAASIGITVYRVAAARWLDSPPDQELAALFTEAVTELRETIF